MGGTEDLIWFFVFMIALALAAGAIVWYTDKKEEEKAKKAAKS